MIRALFVDVGGVLLTNGWDSQDRKLASEKFDLDLEEMESRHKLTFDTFEIGKLSLEEYLNRVVFYKKRPFTPLQFIKFMHAQSQAFPEMIELMRSFKSKHRLKIAVVSNEGRELNEYRIRKFKLDTFVDFFISSCFVHLRKPDIDMFKMALDLAHVPPNQVLYIDDRPLFVQAAQSLGIHGLHHTDYASTLKKLTAAFPKI